MGTSMALSFRSIELRNERLTSTLYKGTKLYRQDNTYFSAQMGFILIHSLFIIVIPSTTAIGYSIFSGSISQQRTRHISLENARGFTTIW